MSDLEMYILSVWLAFLFYGLYASLFVACFYIVVEKKNYRTVPARVMFVTMLLMFAFTTVHVGMNFYRGIKGYVWLRDGPGGPVGFFSDISRWDTIVKGIFLIATSIIGDGLAIYRCWIVWSNNYYIIALPVVLLIISIVTGYLVCWMFSQMGRSSIFNSRVQIWITVYYSLAVAQNLITTGLIAFRLWRCEKAVSSIINTRRHSNLSPVLRILVESAAAYAAVQTILLAFYVCDLNAQFIILEIIPPTAGIVFSSITLRLATRNTRVDNISLISGAISVPMVRPMKPPAVYVTRSVHTHYDEDWDNSGSTVAVK